MSLEQPTYKNPYNNLEEFYRLQMKKDAELTNFETEILIILNMEKQDFEKDGFRSGEMRMEIIDADGYEAIETIEYFIKDGKIRGALKTLDFQGHTIIDTIRDITEDTQEPLGENEIKIKSPDGNSLLLRGKVIKTQEVKLGTK